MSKPLSEGKTLILTMSESQKRMLARFGEVVGLDATYRVTMWGLPFFVVVVVNAQGHAFPAAFFWISEETSESIAEVLLHMRQMVPCWEPKLMIVDKSDAEIKAIARVFPPPKCFIMLCDFHVKQAWQRWLTASKNRVGDDAKKKEAYALMAAIAHAQTISLMEDAVRALENYIEGSNNEAMRTWWENEWKGCMQMWCRAYRSTKFTRGFNTNNHNESTNKTLKVQLAERYDLKMGSTVRALYDKIMPEYEMKHASEQALEMGRKSNMILPKVLLGGRHAKLPENVTKQIASSASAAEKITPLSVLARSATQYNFIGAQGRYLVNLAEGTCECPHFQSRRIPCKHMLHALGTLNKTVFDLPKELLEAPHMSFDLESLVGQTYDDEVDTNEDATPDMLDADTHAHAAPAVFHPVQMFDDIAAAASSAARSSQVDQDSSPMISAGKLKSKWGEVIKNTTTEFFHNLESDPCNALQMFDLLETVWEKGRQGLGGSSREFSRRVGTRMRNKCNGPAIYKNRGPNSFDSISANGGSRGTSGVRHGGRGGGGHGDSGGRGGRGSGGRGRGGGRSGRGAGGSEDISRHMQGTHSAPTVGEKRQHSNSEFVAVRGKGRPSEKKAKLKWSDAAGRQAKAREDQKQERTATFVQGGSANPKIWVRKRQLHFENPIDRSFAFSLGSFVYRT